jgi:purine-binding chemotaxis protein CheW
MSTDETQTLDVEQFIVFQLGEESYGLPIGSVEEIVRSPDVLTRVPSAPPFVSGLMNLRGKALPVIDQRKRFSAQGTSDRGRGRIVVVTVGDLKAGFLVDAVSEVLTVPTNEVSSAPELTSDAQVIDRVAMIERNGHMILLVDPKALLDRAERDVLKNLTKDAPEARHGA